MRITRNASIIGAALLMVGASALSASAAPSASADNGTQTITALSIGVTADDIGSCNNVWATDTFNKFFQLKNNGNGTYNLTATYRNGTFVTIAGTSPGACEATGADDGSLVGAGITGRETQDWSATVTATAPANKTPDCTNNACVGSGGFLDAVFGPGNYTRGEWTNVSYYTTKNNGSWFDTQGPSVTWPLSDTGDITGTL
jgi:hypothetical protein